MKPKQYLDIVNTPLNVEVHVLATPRQQNKQKQNQTSFTFT